MVVNSGSEGLMGVEGRGPGSTHGRDSGRGAGLGEGGGSRCGIAEGLGGFVDSVSGVLGGSLRVS